MEMFFSGLILILYILSHYAAEPIFLASCLFPLCYVFFTSCALHFGVRGRLISAKRKAVRFVKNGVISGDTRDLFTEKCMKGAPLSLRIAFAAFAEGEISAYEFSRSARASIQYDPVWCLGFYFGTEIALSLLVFSVFYFITPFSETLLRFFLSALFLSANGAVLFFLLHGYQRGAEKAADQLAEILDASLLRMKKKHRSAFSDFFSPKDPQRPENTFTGCAVPASPAAQDAAPSPDPNAALLAMLRELDPPIPPS